MALPASVLKMRDLLLKARVVDEFQMRSALSRLEQWGGRLPKVLADMGMVDEEPIADIIARSLSLPRQSFGTLNRDAQALSKLDVRFCEENAVFPVSVNSRSHTLLVAMADPLELSLIDLMASKAGLRIQVAVAPESEIQAAIARHYRGAVTAPAAPNLARRAFTAEIAPSPSSPEPLELELDRSAPVPLARDELRGVMARAPSANTLLDEMLGDDEQVAPGFTQEDLERLGHVRLTQQRTRAILRALHELLEEKGYPVS